MKRAALFPGQGSQVVGMGKDLCAEFQEARQIFETADSVLSFPLSNLCFEGPVDELKKTVNTQPALLTMSMAVLGILKKRGFQIQAVAGHSLGSYSALVAAEVLDFKDALRLVRWRGELMEQVGAGKGTMAAILGLTEEKVREACDASRSVGVVEPANVNCPGQIVISGELEAVKFACIKAKELGAKRAMELSVSGPFHSSLMAPAAEMFKKELEGVAFSVPKVPYYSDIDAVSLSDPEMIRKSLARQLVMPVMWTKVIETMLGSGITDFIEVGPGRVLSGLIGKISGSTNVSNAGDVEGIRKMEAN